MARIYAGVLGLLAFLIALVRGLVHGQGVDGVLSSACLSLAVFGALGMLIGAWAQWIVEDAVNSRLATEMAAEGNRKSE